jgi:hypothetical protein
MHAPTSASDRGRLQFFSASAPSPSSARASVQCAQSAAHGRAWGARAWHSILTALLLVSPIGSLQPAACV